MKSFIQYIKEANELDEGLYHVSYGLGLDHQVVAKDASDAHKKAMAHFKKTKPKLNDPKYADTFDKKSITRIKGDEPRSDKYKTEEIEQIDEISTEKLRDYAGKALQDKNKAKSDKRWKYGSKATDIVGDRDTKAAHDLKFNKTEEVEQIDEISKKLAKSYLDKSAAEREANPKYSTREKFRSRMIGGATADAKLKGRVEQPYKFGQAPKRKMYVKVAATNEETDLD
jgi:hypothetical protein